MRRQRLLNALSIGLVILTAPASQACPGFAQSAARCRMADPIAMPESGAPMLGHAEHRTENAVVARDAREARPDREGPAVAEVPCHEEGRPAADCCRNDTAPGQIQGLSFSTPEAAAPVAALARVLAMPDPALDCSEAVRANRPPPHEKPRYALFSSYLL